MAYVFGIEGNWSAFRFFVARWSRWKTMS